MKIAGRYALEKVIREGTEGIFHRAKDERGGKEVGLLILRAEGSEEHRATFLARAEELAKIRHPNLERILASGEEEGRPYAVIELLEGESLGEHLRQGPPLSVEEVIRALAEVLSGLDKLHKKRLAHGLLEAEPSGSHLLLSQARGRVVPKLTGLLAAGIEGSFEGDAAADRRAIAALAYALLVGALPAQNAEPEEIGALRPALKGPLATAIERELSLEGRKRHKDTAAFQRALRTATILARGLKEEQTRILAEGGAPATEPISEPEPPEPEASEPTVEQDTEEVSVTGSLEMESFDELGITDAPDSVRAPPPRPHSEALPKIPALPGIGAPKRGAPAPPPPPPSGETSLSPDRLPPDKEEIEVTFDPADDVAEQIDLTIADPPASEPPAAPPKEEERPPEARPRRVSEHPVIAAEPAAAPALPPVTEGESVPPAGPRPAKGRGLAVWGIMGFLLFFVAGGLGLWLYLGRGGGSTEEVAGPAPEATAEPSATETEPVATETETEPVATEIEPEPEPEPEPETETEPVATEPETETEPTEAGDLDPDRVRITFRNLPEDARITIDDRSVHSESVDLRRSSRDRQIRIRARGYHTFRRTLSGDESIEIELDMERR